MFSALSDRFERAAASPTSAAPQRQAFLEGLRNLGYVEGRDYEMVARSAYGTVDRLPALAEEIASRPASSQEDFRRQAHSFGAERASGGQEASELKLRGADVKGQNLGEGQRELPLMGNRIR